MLCRTERQRAAEGREPNLRWMGRKQEEDDLVSMQQRTENEMGGWGVGVGGGGKWERELSKI